MEVQQTSSIFGPQPPASTGGPASGLGSNPVHAHRLINKLQKEKSFVIKYLTRPGEYLWNVGLVFAQWNSKSIYAASMRCKSFLVFYLIMISVANAQVPTDPDYDPLIDKEPEDARHRYTAPVERGSGFTVAGSLGLYYGRVNSYLTPRESQLLQGTRPSIGFGLGYRTNSQFELAIDVSLGLGKSFDVDNPEGTFAFDMLVEPRLLFHWYEQWPWSMYSGVGALAGLFDVETSGISQAGIGPTVVLGTILRSDGSSGAFVECAASYFYDVFAFRVSEDDSVIDSMTTVGTSEKDEGDWFPIFRVTLGYRLTSF